LSSSNRRPPLTTTSFAILGLLAIQPWTTYELAQQMERTLNRMWPRARSKLYEEPKKLVAHRLAVAAREQVGNRPRTVYSITPAGRRALAEWLQTPGAGPVLEFEQLTKLFFADHGRKQDALATLDATSAWAAEQLAVFAEAATDYLAGRGPFPQRIATTVLGARFAVDFYLTTLQWARWARTLVEQWPDDPSEATVEAAILEELVQRASTGAAR
jgi:PadR family transcriptional regulator AphA